MTKKSISLTQLHYAIAHVTSESVINLLQLKNKGLRTHLKNEFRLNYGQGGDFLADPVVEATFGWKPSKPENSMLNLAADSYLTYELVKCMDQAYAPDTEKQREDDRKSNKARLGYAKDIHEDYTWPAERPPYLHQLKAWEALSRDKPQSTVVTSGTGSGKTECFLVPLLNDLAKQIGSSGEVLVGVQAIMLYPLNALINSQKERLSAWTRGFEGKIRYALYTGDTPHEPPSKATKALGAVTPEQVDNRQDIRKYPPPILVTNSTILEYMLVRPIDREILQKSQGKLRWIILDEAHTLVGTQAAEISLLLRRTMLAFGVQPEDVRFVATSATIGDSSDWLNTKTKLEEFLAGLAGVKPEQVTVISGERLVPSLPEYEHETDHFSLENLESMDSGKAFSTFCKMLLMRNLREKLSQRPLTITEIAQHLFPGESQVSTNQKLQASRLIDIATKAFPNGDDTKEPFLRIRAHMFHRAQRGLWSCVDPNCRYKTGTALADGWPFGNIYFDERTFCLEGCGAPVYEVTHCKECSEPSLAAAIVSDEKGNRVVLSRRRDEADEFSDDIEHSQDEEDLEHPIEIKKLDSIQIFSTQSDIHSRYLAVGGSVEAFVESDGRKLKNTSDAGISVRYTVADRDSPLRCACCDTTEQLEGQTFKRALMGSPFLMGNIVPEMLQHVPRKDMNSLKGSRLITFTDSRQGTARFSAKLQLDAERRWCRSVVYHALADAKSDIRIEDDEILKSYISASLNLPQDARGRLNELIEARRTELSKNIVARLDWNSMVTVLANTPEIKLLSGETDDSNALDDVEDSIPGEYEERDAQLSSAKNLAHLFLLREFARRPKKANNLETLGLVKVIYPALDRISEEDLRKSCRDWISIGLTLKDWKDYLKIILDYYIRENVFVDIHSYQINWMGGKIYARLLRDQDFQSQTEDEKLALRAFPSVNKGNQNRLIRILEIATNRTATNDPILFNKLLKAAWQTLINLKILEYYKDGIHNYRQGYHLKFDRAVAFETTETASLCPVTGRWIDTAFCGLSPYVTNKLELDDIKIVEGPLTIPHPDKNLLSSKDSVALRRWLINEPFVCEQRQAGNWRDVADNVLLPPILLRSVEHSAQQDSAKLQKFEKAFKKDFLNVLNCSTTMEMGVDIGALSMVAMNNAPPSTSNYLQRAGRAGRRSESISIVLTFCKANPHGERIFANPKWPFEVAIPVPRVALESIPIVRRHVNAFLFSEFLKTKLGQESLPELKAGKFFLKVGKISHYDRFIAWVEHEATCNEIIKENLEVLVSGSCLSGQSAENLVMNVADSMMYAANHWLSRYYSLSSEIELAVKGDHDSDAALRRMKTQCTDMEGSFLLNELAKRGFMPGYGFPTNVVELVTNNKNEKAKLNKGYPSRTLETALREYAPGKDVVLNGAVYRSQGLQLSWRIPNQDREIAKAQKLRHVVYCLDCGHHEADLLNSADISTGGCPECSGRRQKIMEYIIPDGFQVDFKSPLHNDYAQPHYAPYIEPFITAADSEWQVLQSVELGRFKISDNGQLFFYNDGNGAGYAMCWSCGRMEALNAKGSQGVYHVDIDHPADLLVKPQHNRLSGIARGESFKCENAGWSMKVSSTDPNNGNLVKVPFILGHETTTSIFELQLRDPETNRWIDDNTAMYSLGAALRQVFCREKGISTDEIGLTICRRNTYTHEKASSIFLFDTAEQGAGYSSSISEILPLLFKQAYQFIIDCPSKCDLVCHGCLLDFDTQHNADNLDRHAVIRLFERLKIHERFSVSKGRQFFGDGSIPELCSAQRLVSLKGRAAKAVDIFISSNDWDVSQSSILKNLNNLKGCDVRLLVASSIVGGLSPNIAWQLARTLGPDISVFKFLPLENLGGNAHPVLRMVFTDGEYWYATDDFKTTSLNGDWGSTPAKSLVACKNRSFLIEVEPLDILSLATSSSMQNNIALISDIGKRLNVPIAEFGVNLHALICEKSPLLNKELSGGIRKLVYRDRYLMSPLSIYLICNFFSALRNQYGVIQCEIETTCPEIRGDKVPYCIADNFRNSTEAQDFISSLSESLNVDIYTEFMDKSDLDHGRYLNVELLSGETIQLLFDQGMGYWSARRPYSRIKFNFDEIGNLNIDSWNFNVIAIDGASYIVVHKINL